ncbi:uncharacterized protein K452DRAFT_355633 [Aplosporella prunicola CBS 121167]|uniref:Histidine acid phosphatase n=1 Tax=Aplosporella prunicola CBS 121167 TaxID=1176127 RepID=A0A6A6BQ26_9PEZI|nr:uncharacterized protein K452DRAFT_355633 [Aplosporella prunicola CBS 121167]KAF2146196.1 hypothetical protein K452DRAFT_355633 [Aplosporella prunicola CBS 121167]
MAQEGEIGHEWGAALQPRRNINYVSSTFATAISFGLLLWILGSLTSTENKHPLTWPKIITSEKPSMATSLNSSVEGWHPPNSTWINDLSKAINGTGVHGFVFNGSELPEGTPYGMYNWCNMPHVRAEEYPKASDEYQLEYVEVIHRHHKRTPYAANTFPHETYIWNCNSSSLFYYGSPAAPDGNITAQTYWDVYISASNPLAPTGFNGTCQFPQITGSGLNDAWQHGRDLGSVYGGLLHFLPEIPATDGWGRKVEFRVTNNIITSQVAGMVISGIYPDAAAHSFPLKIQPDSVDSLEPGYTCPAAAALYATYGIGSRDPAWLEHLSASDPLFKTLDRISGIPSAEKDWHQSFDHYYDNLSARLCHQKPLPCNDSLSDATTTSSTCIPQFLANTVFRLGQLEYSRLYRDDPASLAAAVASYGIWLAELAQNLRDAAAGTSDVVYRHNVAHDGSLSRLLAVLQVDVMVWPGMGSEVVFELFSRKAQQDQGRADARAAEDTDVEKGKSFVRVLWGGRVLRSSHPVLGRMDMVALETLLEYFDGLVGVGAERVPGLCGLS